MPTPGAARLLSMQDLSDRYGVPLQTVRRWRTTNYGPAGFAVGRYVRYRLADVEAWEQSQLDAA
ncbi:helix-turn-helix domain-containing protein [Kocuria sediminis]|uniref:Helix-turn-helix domain-containing protein n=1 Tax=Kocuria sediminis TaxID=1038857 RepID=A0A6N8GEG3_9MICC|nr:helix-turn-helix domain-containing protein [Kocuria sediminis]MUN61586.1 helix-turn-helix domain-containing protein [Kocuria sediminis]